MKSPLFLRNVIVALGLSSLFFTAWSVEIKNLNIAIIWNNETYSDVAPWGFNVGGSAASKDGNLAPEIGKAQLKLLLASLDTSIHYDSTTSLDTAGIPDRLFDSTGINGRLKNIRIYTNGDDISYSKIKSDFYGRKISSILYINGGYLAQDEEIYKTLREAANDEVGIMSLGSVSATEAEHIDTSKTTFPVMGVQKTFHFKASIDKDLIKEFQFMTDNDIKDSNGKTIWEIPDTVDLELSNNIARIIRFRNNTPFDTLYEYNIGTKKVTKNISIVPNSDIIVSESGEEWSIKAKAVEVIDNDEYAPEMNSGIYNNHDVSIYWDGSTVKVPASSYNWIAKIRGGADVVADYGQALPNISNYGTFSGGKFTLSKDYVREVKDVDNATFKDSILILRKGVEVLAQTPDYNDNYVDTYLASGYKELKINFLQGGTQIHQEVFDSLSKMGISSIKFKPWRPNGRIRCDADVWAFNTKLPLVNFDSLYTGKVKFDSTKYYISYLADQTAGTHGAKQIVKAPGKLSDFNLSYDDQLVDSLGYDTSNKLYHVISVAQKNHRRLAMLNFQPTYLTNFLGTKVMLLDVVKWISVDDFKEPKPELLPSDSSYIFTDFDTIKFVVDFTSKGDALRKAPYDLICSLTYQGKIVGDTTIHVPEGTTDKLIDTHSVSIKAIGVNIDSTDTLNTTIGVKASVKPTSTTQPFQGDSASFVLLIYQLDKPWFARSSGVFQGLSVEDSIICDSTTVQTVGKVDTTSGIKDVSISYTKDSNPEVAGNSPLKITVTEDKSTVVAFATKARYINSRKSVKNYTRNSTPFHIEKAYYIDSDANPDGYIDIVNVVLDSSTLALINASSSLTTDDVAAAVKDSLILPSDLTIVATSGTSTGFAVVVTQDKTNPPATTVDANDKLDLKGDVPVKSLGILVDTTVSIDDSLAPVITVADYYPTGDSLVVVFSEKTTNPDIAKNLLSFSKASGIPYSMNFSAVSKGVSDSVWKFTVSSILDTGGSIVYPTDEDSVLLAGSGSLSDLISNTQSKDTKKVPLSVHEYTLTLSSNAYYLDTNTVADGYFDELVLTFDDKSLGLLTDPSSGITIGGVVDSLKKIGKLMLTSDKNLSIREITATSNAISISLNPDKSSVPVTSVNATDQISIAATALINGVAGINATKIQVIDSVAPVITYAKFYLDGDSLDIHFSEDVNKPDTVNKLFIFTDVSGAEFSVTLGSVLTTASSGSNYVFSVTSVTDGSGVARIPVLGDSVQLTSTCNVSDLVSNVQDHNTVKVPLFVGTFSIGFSDAYYLDTSSLADGYIDIVHITLDSASLSKIDSKSDLTTSDIAVAIKDTILLPSDLFILGATGVSDGIELSVLQNKTSAAVTTVDSMDFLIIKGNVDVNGGGVVTVDTLSIDDSIAPVLNSVTLSPSEKSLEVKFSEKITTPDITKEPFIFTDPSGSEYKVNLSAIISSKGVYDHFTFQVSSITGLDGITEVIPMPGDSVQIKGGSGITDMLSNSQLNKTVKVPLEVTLYNLALYKAYYLDTNTVADGYIDQVVIKYDDYTMSLINSGTIDVSSQGIVDSLVAKNLIVLPEFRKLTTTDVVAEANGFVVNVVQDTTDYPNTAVTPNDIFIDSATSFIGSMSELPADTLPIEDSLAPVVIFIIFNPNNDISEKDTSKGMLIVGFSESVSKPDNIANVLKFTDGTIDYTMDLTYDSANVDSTIFYYTVLNVNKKTYPEDGDIGQIDINSQIKDKNGNVQNNAMDPVIIKVGEYENNFQVGVLGPIIPNVSVIPDDALDFLNVKGKIDNKGALIIIDIKGAILENDDWSVQTVLYDAVGNVVRDNINMVFTTDDKGNSKIVGSWDGKNMNSRVVGSGGYLFIVGISKNGELLHTYKTMLIVGDHIIPGAKLIGD